MLKKDEQGNDYYHFENEKELFSIVEIYVNKQNKLKRCIYKYNPQLTEAKGVWMEMNFKVINHQPNFKSGTFSETQFVQLENNKLKGIGAYKSYTVHHGN